MQPQAINQKLILMFALAQCQQYVKIGISILKLSSCHLLLSLPFAPISDDIYFMGIQCRLGVVVEVDGLSGTGSFMTVSTFTTQVKLIHSKIIYYKHNQIITYSFVFLAAITQYSSSLKIKLEQSQCPFWPNLYLGLLLNIEMSLKLASGSYDNTIRFWDPSTGTSNSSQTIRLNSAPNRIQITEDKTKIVVGMNNCVKIYDLNKPQQPTRTFENDFKGNVTAVGCFYKQQKYIYTACEDGYLRVFDIKSKNMVKSIKHNKPINCAVLHPNEGSILTGDEAGLFVDWDLSTQKDKGKLDTNFFGIRSITISQNGQHMIIADSNGDLYPYMYQHYARGKVVNKAHDDYILKVQLSPNNKLLATCAADKKIKLYKVVIDKGSNDNLALQLVQHKTLKGHLRWVWDCQFSCDSAYLISCSTDQTIKLWQVEKGELVQTLKGHQKGVCCLALNDIAQP